MYIYFENHTTITFGFFLILIFWYHNYDFKKYVKMHVYSLYQDFKTQGWYIGMLNYSIERSFYIYS